VLLEGLGKLKNLLASSGLDPAIVRLVTTLPRVPVLYSGCAYINCVGIALSPSRFAPMGEEITMM
jgi:hypothetical protein